MGKRGLVLVIAVILVLAANAAHSPTITIAPNHLYEGQEDWFNISIDNFGSQHTINVVDVTMPVSCLWWIVFFIYSAITLC